MIRIARVEGCAPPAESRGLCNDGHHYNSLLNVDELGINEVAYNLRFLLIQ